MGIARIIRSEKVKASTLVEVVVAMIIIMAVFAIAITIFINLTRTTTSLRTVKARAILNEQLYYIGLDPSPSNKIVIIDSLRVEETVTLFLPGKVWQVNIQAFDQNNKKLAELNEMIPTKP